MDDVNLGRLKSFADGLCGRAGADIRGAIAEIGRLRESLARVEAERDEARARAGAAADERDRWKSLAEERRKTLLCRDGTIQMAVDRLEGIVEGRPTHSGNFLQRVDELREVEREAERLKAGDVLSAIGGPHTPAGGEPDESRAVAVRYTNWRGEAADRRIVPLSLRWASTEWHPGEQWIVEAWDVGKQAVRSFALAGFGGPPAPAAIVHTTGCHYVAYESLADAEARWSKTLNTIHRVIGWEWHPASSPGEPPTPAEDGVSLIAAERRRQVEREGWTAEHDDGHDGGQLAITGAAYALLAAGRPGLAKLWLHQGACFPLKPKDPVRNLARAGALIAAEIDRLRRLERKPASSPGEDAE